MKRAKRTPHTKDRADSEKRLIEAAKAVFSKHGFNGATTRMIAEKAGVNLALIARYFGNKQGLLIAVIRSGAKESRRQPLCYPEQDSLRKECVKYAETRFELMFEQIDLFRIVIVQLITDRESAKIMREPEFIEPSSLSDRIAPYFKKSEALEKFVSLLETNILGTIIIHHLMMGESRERCLELARWQAAALSKSFAN